MLQQQAAQLSIQRAASGIGGRDGGGGHHKRPSGGVSTLGGAGPGAGTLLGSVDGGQQVRGKCLHFRDSWALVESCPQPEAAEASQPSL